MSKTPVRRINGFYDVNILMNHDVYYYDNYDKKVELGKPIRCGTNGCVYKGRAPGGGNFHLARGGEVTLYYDKDASSTSSTKNASGKKRRNPKSNKIRKIRKIRKTRKTRKSK